MIAEIETCGHCGQKLTAKSWHSTTCQRLIEEVAAGEIQDEPNMAKFVGYPGAELSRERCAEAHHEWPESVEFHESVAKEIRRQKAGGELRCRRCEEIEVEKVATGDESVVEGVTGRHGLAHNMAEWLEGHKLNPGRQCVVDRAPDKKHYRVCWSMADAVCGGEVQMFSAAWIRVTWLGIPDWMPDKGHRVFESTFNAEMFLDLAFADRDWEAAQKVPVKQEWPV